MIPKNELSKINIRENQEVIVEITKKEPSVYILMHPEMGKKVIAIVGESQVDTKKKPNPFNIVKDEDE